MGVNSHFRPVPWFTRRGPTHVFGADVWGRSTSHGLSARAPLRLPDDCLGPCANHTFVHVPWVRTCSIRSMTGGPSLPRASTSVGYCTPPSWIFVVCFGTPLESACSSYKTERRNTEHLPYTLNPSCYAKSQGNPMPPSNRASCVRRRPNSTRVIGGQ
jgi:hypothetical protein